MASSVLFKCISTKAAMLNGHHLLVLNFSTDSGVEAVKFFNASVSTPGRYKVSKNSDFARLYRMTIGDVQLKRLSGEVHQIMKHFVGHSFQVTYKQAFDRNKKPYQKVMSIAPKEVKYSDDWTSTGTIIQRKGSGRQNATTLATTVLEGDLNFGAENLDGQLRNNGLKNATTLATTGLEGDLNFGAENLENADKLRIFSGQTADKQRTNCGQTADKKTL